MAVGTQMQQRRATAAVWATSDKVLASGELGVTTDTGLIKIGDGSNVWSDLPAAFGSEFLPLLGKAADSELLDGISSDGFLKLTDAATAATADKVAMRTSAGRIKAVAALADEDVPTYLQMTAADTAAVAAAALAQSQEHISRTVSDATTLETFQAGDVGKLIVIINSSTTVLRLIKPPLNSVTAIPVGSWIDVVNSGVGNLKFDGSGGITLQGSGNVDGNYSPVRFLKTATDTWMPQVLSGRRGKMPHMRVYKSAGGTSYTSGTHTAVPYNTIDTTNTHNPSDEWFTIPSPNLATARRIVVQKDGLYGCLVNWNGALQQQAWIKVFKLTANNVLGDELTNGPTFWNGHAYWQGRLTAGQSVGGAFYPQTTQNDEADGLSGSRNDFSITRLSE